MGQHEIEIYKVCNFIIFRVSHRLCPVLLLGYSAIPGIPLYVAKIFTELTLFLISYVVQKKVIFRHKF